jgi:Hydrazine synthase alpha subunit middle domain
MKLKFPSVVLFARISILLALCSLALIACSNAPVAPPTGTPPSPLPPVTGSFPILFVTQVPIAADFTTVAATFGNQRATMESVGRGGDLWIRYTDGTLKNLTKTAGYGADGMQLANAIAVRDPSVHWDATKAVFSMVVGAPLKQYETPSFQWQLFEITGLGKNDAPVITKVPNQPAYNNVSPIYGTDDRIIFTSDRPRDGSAHLYPQRDEYEEAPTVSGLWSLEPKTGDLNLLNHAPSGDFTPILDSFGRVVFTQWDHLKRDQQADADKYAGGTNGTFNYASEDASAAKLNSRAEIFPEPRVTQETAGTNLNLHDFNQFFPWAIFEDGSEGETLNHAGRHELMSGDARGYLTPSFTDDPALKEYFKPGISANLNYINNLFQIKEDPLHQGVYFGTNTSEFYTHASGQIVSLSAPPTLPADKIVIQNITDKATGSTTAEGATPDPKHSGLYRDPLPLSDGALIAAHTAETRVDKQNGSPTASRYDYRLKTLKKNASGAWVADQPLTAGIAKSVSYWDPDAKVTYNGNLWELQPVEVKPRARPARLTASLSSVEGQLFTQAGVNETALRDYLKQNNLALAVVRNVTSRDEADKQQPFNLRVPGGAQTLGAGFKSGDKVYDVAHLQFFQADLIRGIGGTASPQAGRRVLPQVMHDPKATSSNPAPTGPAGSVAVSSDGSVAAFVPARRAMSWQLTDGAGTSVVRERYWVTFQPGEIRVCGSCHGLNERDQAGQVAPINPPKALLELLQRWKTLPK